MIRLEHDWMEAVRSRNVDFLDEEFALATGAPATGFADGHGALAVLAARSNGRRDPRPDVPDDRRVRSA